MNNFIYFREQGFWKRYNLETDELDEGEPPLPSNEDVEFSEEKNLPTYKKDLSA